VSAICSAAQFVRRLEKMQAQDADGTARTTFNVGQISGGTGVNVVPSHCDVVWEIRPAADADVRLLKKMADKLVCGAAARDFKPETQETIAIPPLRPQPGNPARAIAQRFGAAATDSGLPFGTEGGFFQDAGIPTIVCGPGSITQAHQADEWIAIDQLEQASRFLDQVTQWAAA